MDKALGLTETTQDNNTCGNFPGGRKIVVVLENKIEFSERFSL